MPSSEDEFALSLAMSDHYFDKAGIEKMAAKISAGEPLTLDPETRRKLIITLRDNVQQMPFLKIGEKATDIDYQPPPSKKLSWWKKLF